VSCRLPVNKRCSSHIVSVGRAQSLGTSESSITLPVSERRFLPPWSVEDIGAAFVVKDGSGQKLGYFSYEEEPGRRSHSR